MTHEQTDPDLTSRVATGAATEEVMGTLHGTVARVLTAAISSEDVNAALLGAAITFLKNNNITASPSNNKDLAALKTELGKKRQRKELTSRSLKEAADTFEQMQGANGMPLQ